MPRIDIWDVQKPDNLEPIDCGFARNFEERYWQGELLGKGGFGKVFLATEKSTGREYACKSVSKRLDIPNLSPQKQAAYLDNIKREILVLKRLKGVLSVAQLKEALEDDDCIYIVLEYCKGGELLTGIGKHHYSETTVASYIRAVLRTVIQCHYQKILHRDIKPGNFMLLEDQPLSPVKAIDFGLAVFFDPDRLPRKDLGLEGTPWFMSPEMLNSEVGPASDVWAVGVMTYQLLSGYLPFDDHKNRESPSLSKVWKAILTDEVAFKGKAWLEVSEHAKDFICQLLDKDPHKRPTAKDIMLHPWLKDTQDKDRELGRPLRHTVVQRIQRYGQGNILERSILELIAQEIINMAPETPDGSNHGNSSDSGEPRGGGKREAEGSAHRQSAMQMLSNFKRRKSRRDLGSLVAGPGGGAMEGPPLIHRDHHSVHGGLEYFKARGESVHNGRVALHLSGKDGPPTSVHGGGSYWRLMRATAAALRHKDGQGQSDYLRFVPRCEDELEEHRKVARLALDTSMHASSEYKRFLRQVSSPSLLRKNRSERSMHHTTNPSGHGSENGGTPPRGDLAQNGGGNNAQQNKLRSPTRQLIPVPSSDRPASNEDQEQQVRGRHAYRQFLHNSGSIPDFQHSYGHAEDGPPALQRNSAGPSYLRGRSLDLTGPTGSVGSEQGISKSGSVPDLPGMPAVRKVSFGSVSSLARSEHSSPGGSRQASQHGPPARPDFQGSDNLQLGVTEMKELMRRLNFSKEVESVSEEELAEGLRQLGYRIRPEEMSLLAQQVNPSGRSGTISKSAFLASQMDWHRDDLRELWIQAARKVFADFGSSVGGKVSYAALMDMVRRKIPESEVEYAVEDALVEEGYADEEELDFDGFMRIINVDKITSLDHFEARLPRPASQGSLGHAEPSPRPPRDPQSASLPVVAEDA